MKQLSTLFTTALLVVFLSACGQQTGSGTDAAPATSGGRIKPLSFQEWGQQLESYQPKVVVVDLWAMWCSPCIERFPKMVDMHEQYASKGVEIVAVNLDNRDDKDALQRAETFLAEIGANFDNYHMNENLIEAFEHFGLIGIPAVVIYDGEGRERYRLTGTNPNKQFTDKDIEAAINELLAEQDAAA
ncbi:TlpA family protein disulfide reductase [Gilvimarinus sp. F26214L]|uniref:TlpA family protein disulfide reductase n=1 Tax=Gilvimarinus sp. DZF01 TaxID=3461371 RepID=UPI0040466AD3